MDDTYPFYICSLAVVIWFSVAMLIKRVGENVVLDRWARTNSYKLAYSKWTWPFMPNHHACQIEVVDNEGLRRSANFRFRYKPFTFEPIVEVYWDDD